MMEVKSRPLPGEIAPLGRLSQFGLSAFVIRKLTVKLEFN